MLYVISTLWSVWVYAVLPFETKIWFRIYEHSYSQYHPVPSTRFRAFFLLLFNNTNLNYKLCHAYIEHRSCIKLIISAIFKFYRLLISNDQTIKTNIILFRKSIADIYYIQFQMRHTSITSNLTSVMRCHWRIIKSIFGNI